MANGATGELGRAVLSHVVKESVRDTDHVPTLSHRCMGTIASGNKLILTCVTNKRAPT